MDRSPSPGFWHQQFPFTCGPAALGSVLGGLGWVPARSRTDEELELWRESTAIACPGSHPFALALAAHRRGFLAQVFYSGPRPWLWAHIRAQHGGRDQGGYRLIETNLERSCAAAGIQIEFERMPPEPTGPGLLLTTTRGEVPGHRDPHWVGFRSENGAVRVADPVRRTFYPTTAPFPERWRRSGFEETRCWISIGRGASAAPEKEPPRGSDRNTAERGGSPHGHHHHHGAPLERRAWSREEAIVRLEAPERRATQDPAVLWKHVGLRPGELVVDVGAGTGYFAIEAARRVGPSGKVYAVDLSEELVELLRERRDEAGLTQLEPVQNTLEEIPLDSGIADLVLLANVLHDIPPSTVSEAVRLLKPGGRFVNVDWKKTETPGGPPLGIRLDPAEAARTLNAHGLRMVEEWEFGPWHYALRLERAPRSERTPRNVKS